MACVCVCVRACDLYQVFCNYHTIASSHLSSFSLSFFLSFFTRQSFVLFLALLLRALSVVKADAGGTGYRGN